MLILLLLSISYSVQGVRVCERYLVVDLGVVGCDVVDFDIGV